MANSKLSNDVQTEAADKVRQPAPISKQDMLYDIMIRRQKAAEASGTMNEKVQAGFDRFAINIDSIGRNKNG